MKGVKALGDGIREAVFGANDGVVSTFGILSGMVGAALSGPLIALVGVIQMFAAGLSMGLGAYISTKSQNEYYESEEHRIEREIDVHPAREKKEVKKILAEKGLSGKKLSSGTDSLTSNRKAWLSFILEERLGIAETSYPHPVFAGTVMFISFVIAGFFVVLPFFLLEPRPALALSTGLSLVILFIVGATKTRFTHRNPWFSGFENLLVGAVTGVVGYVVGAIVQGVI